MNPTIFDILLMEEEQLFYFLVKHLKKYYPEVISYPLDFVAAYSDNPILLLAHIDSVRSKYERIKLIRINDLIKNRYGILSADDRAGVYAILEILALCTKKGIVLPSVLFTNGEEYGGTGMKSFISLCGNDIPRHINLLVALDRKHANEYVYYSSYLPQAVKRYVESFGYIEAQGSYNDVADLTNFTKIPGINVSVGYYRAHTEREVLHYSELRMTCYRITLMLRRPLSKLFRIENPFSG